MIQIKQATLRRGLKVLLDSADLMIYTGMRVGIVGRNGCGKSSLFGLLTNELQVEAGDVEIPRAWTIASVAQDTPPSEATAIDYVLDGDRELRTIEAELDAAEAADDGDRLGHAHEEYGRIDGYSARARAAALLGGLGFAASEHTQQVRTFSGGWRMRLNLGQALMCRSDLLLLDEPTNHLDLDTVMWLENWLNRYRGTLLVISHDREFLDAVAQGIVGFESGKLRLTTGNYSAFEQDRATRLSQYQSLYARQQKQVAHLRSFVDRFRAQATKARQAQSRLKALARMELIAPAHVDSGFTLHFREFPGSPDPALTIDDASVGYDGRAIIEHITTTIPAGSRIGLIGVNGAGKTTLVKLLAGLLEPMAGERLEGKNLRIGYFAQHQVELLREDESPLQHMRRLDAVTREQQLRDFLGQFNFSGDAAMQAAGTMSGGEQARLALALIIWQRPNLLLLDEPTNHLDLDMREALTMALQEFEGSMILVSHDRHLLRTSTDQLMLVAHGEVVPYDGDLDEYRAFLEGRGAPAAPAPKEEAKKPAETIALAPSARKEDRRADAQTRAVSNARRKPITDRITRIEREMGKLEPEKKRLEVLLASEGIYAPAQKDALVTATHEAAKVAAGLQTLEEEWLVLQAELESLASASI